LRYELRGQGTLVIGVHPGYIDTDMAAGVDAPKSSPEEVVEMTLQAVKDGIEEVSINDEARRVKQSLSSTEAAYLTFGR
jgi:NAD(P)-dependent dehydrogenase (short-subunit alcohol dehydrogenase family)